jgi:hypothetical protein
MVLCSLKRLHVTSFPSKETDNMDRRYDLPRCDRLRGSIADF